MFLILILVMVSYPECIYMSKINFYTSNNAVPCMSITPKESCKQIQQSVCNSDNNTEGRNSLEDIVYGDSYFR